MAQALLRTSPWGGKMFPLSCNEAVMRRLIVVAHFKASDSTRSSKMVDRTLYPATTLTMIVLMVKGLRIKSI